MIDFRNGSWIFEPKKSFVSDSEVCITTEPETDFWQRSYYGFRKANAPALLLESNDNFTFSTAVEFCYQKQFDQCGVILYLDDENWFKASIEYETASYSRLGSVVTNHGYSDWATADLQLPEKIWYRLSRRGPDFLIESSTNGTHFHQMRIFHIHELGGTSKEMASANPPIPADKSVRFGLYAYSPLKSSFTAKFTNMNYGRCQWLPHSDPEFHKKDGSIFNNPSRGMVYKRS